MKEWNKVRFFLDMAQEYDYSEDISPHTSEVRDMPLDEYQRQATFFESTYLENIEDNHFA